jgi:methyl-accepting chemotaxis protein
MFQCSFKWYYLSILLLIIEIRGELLGIIGADFDATGVYKMMQQEKINLLTVGVLLLVIIFVYLLARYLAKPLKTY